MDRPLILCGLGRIGWRILEYLQAGGFAVVVIDTNCSVDDPRLGKARLVRGDGRRPEVLEAAGVREAGGVLIVTSDDVVNVTAALAVRNLNPVVRIVIRMVNENLISRFGKAVANVEALSLATLVGPVLARTAVAGQALGAFQLADTEQGTYQVSEVLIRQGSWWRQRTIEQIGAEHRVVVLAHQKAGQKASILDAVQPLATVETGDRLIVCGRQLEVAGLLAGVEEEVLPHVLWASFIRRHLRAFGRTLREIDLLVKITTAVLIGAIVVSTLVLYAFGEREINGDHKALDSAFFDTVSLMATGGEMRARNFPGPLKVFAALLRIAGAAIVAAFTAIVTNYLLRAHLGGAFEVRRIPDSGHVVVCGLGNIGFRVVQELKADETGVVAVERAADNPFVGTTRGLGIPVVVGDATVPAVLARAHAASARAVIAATTNDLVNLEIALLVREKNPQQRVIPCLADPNLAQSIREAANIRLTVSIPALAAPAFIASLFGDKVHSVFMLERRLMAAVDLTVQSFDTWLSGRAVRAIAVDYRMVPVALFAPDGQACDQVLEARLEPGWRLVGILALRDLERLFRRIPVPQEWCLRVFGLTGENREAARLILGSVVHDSEPTILLEDLTRGEAEHLRVQLNRSKIDCELCTGEPGA